MPFTWQVYAGVAWQPTNWVDVSVGYRYLSFQGGSKTIGFEKLNLGGACSPAISTSEPEFSGATGFTVHPEALRAA